MQPTPTAQTRILATLAALACLALGTARADDLTWNLATGGAWDYAIENWTGGVLDNKFADGDSVTFSNAVTGIISVTAGVAPSAITVNAASGTYTFSGGPITGSATLSKSGAGRLRLDNANTFTGGTTYSGTDMYNYQLDIRNASALGTGTLTLTGGAGVGFNLPAAGGTFDNPIIVNSGTGTANITTFNAPLTLTGGLTVNGTGSPALYLNRTNFGQHLIILAAPTTGTGSVRVHVGAVSFSNVNQLPPGNLFIGDGGGGILVFDNVSWGDFAASRAGYGTGVGQWQIGNGGFAARGTPLVVTSTGTSTSTFDRTMVIGTTLAKDGALYANAPVTIARDTVLTGRRDWNVANTGPGLTGAHGTGVVYTITGNITDENYLGIGSLRRGVLGTTPTSGAGAELVLAGTSTWTGSYFMRDIDGPLGGYAHGLNTGPGGYSHNRQASTEILRFDGNQSLPTGNGGQTAYIADCGKGSKGFLLTARTGGETYELAAGMKFVLGADNDGIFGSSGETGTSATLRNSAIGIHSAYPTDASAKNLNLLVRGGELIFGSASNPVRLQPTYGVENGNLDNTINGAATAIYDSLSARKLTKRGEGTLILGNLAYTDLAGTGDTASQFSWQIGRSGVNNQGAAAYFDGAVRGLADGDPLADNSNSLKNFAIALRGGVYEVDGGGAASSLTRALGTDAGQVNWGVGGGGFSAYDGDLAVNLGGAGATFTWGSTANFLPINQSLIFGSTTATNQVDFQNGINLNGAVREIRVLNNPAAAGDHARISGTLIGTGSSGLTKTGDGLLELTNTNTYAGVTTVSAGTLAVTGSLGASTSLVSVAAGAILAGNGTVLRPISVAAGAILAGNLTVTPQGTTSATIAGTLAPGNSIGTLTFDLTATTGGLVLSPGATLEFELGPAGSGDLVRIVGYQPGDLALNNNLIDLINAGGLAKDTTYPLFAFFAADGVTPVEHGLTGGLLLGAVPSGFTGFLLDFSSDPSQIQLYVIPEPTTALLLLGLAGLAARRRRRGTPVRRRPAGLAAINGVCLTALATFSAANGATIIQWNNANPTGNWSTPSNWLGGVAPHTANPGTTDHAVIVDGESAIPVVTTLNSTVWVDTLQISAGDKVVNSGGYGIRFAGTTNTWNNAGTISGEMAGSMFDLQSGSGVINVNSGTLQGNGGGLQLAGPSTYSINNANGTIQAINGGTLHLRTQNVTITGGNLAIDGTSKMNATDVQPKFTFANVTAVNHGLIDWNQDGGGAGRVMSLTFSGTTTLLNSPTGQISLKQADVDSSNWSAWMKFQDTASFDNQGQLTITSNTASALAASKVYVEIAATAAGNFSNTGTIAINHTSASSAHTAQLIAGGSIGNTGTIKVDGIGASVELGTNTFTQTAGELVLHNLGSITAGTVDLQGGSLAGVGTVFADVHAAAGVTIAPGNSAGTLTISGDLVLSAATLLDFELGALAGANDLIVVGGDLVLDGILNISDLGGLERGIYTLFLYDGLLVNHGLTLGSIPRPGMLLVGDGAVRLLVPEPASGILLLGLTALAGRRRR